MQKRVTINFVSGARLIFLSRSDYLEVGTFRNLNDNSTSIFGYLEMMAQEDDGVLIALEEKYGDITSVDVEEA